jgi:Spy/CpxP family protein refolding chaperone
VTFGLRSLALVVSLTACGATGGGARFDLGPSPPVHEAPAARASSPEVGIVMMITDAISQLDLSEDQNRQLNGLVNDVNARHDHVQEMRKVLATDMASSVEAGNVDQKTLLLDAENLGKARAEIADADGKSLEELHRILTPAQRKQFAAALADRADKLPTDDVQTRYGNWRSDLQISPDQNEKIAPKLDADTAGAESARAEREAWQKRLRATAADFPNDAFTAKPYVDPDVVKTTVERIRRVIAFLQAVVPELTPKQQKRAADNLRAEVGASQ